MKQRYADIGFAEQPASLLHALELADDVEAALGSQFHAPLRHQADIVRAHAQRDLQHLARHRRLQIHARFQLRAQSLDVAVLDMAPVLAQMQGDGVGAGALGEQGGAHRVRVSRAAHLAQRGHVVDIDAEFDHSCLSSSKMRRLLSGFCSRRWLINSRISAFACCSVSGSL